MRNATKPKLYTIKKEGCLDFPGGVMRARLARAYAKQAMRTMKRKDSYKTLPPNIRENWIKRLKAESAEDWAIAVEIVRTIRYIHEGNTTQRRKPCK